MSEPYTSDCGVLYHGDCLDVLRGLPASSVDSIVTDPPAGIAFMNLDFDNPDSWQYPITKHGFTDGGNRVPAPAIGSSRNPMCRKCKKHKRGWKTILGCECSEPAFDTQERLHEIREKFIGFLSDVFGESLRVLKPGGFAIVWSLPRTSHWTTLLAAISEGDRFIGIEQDPEYIAIAKQRLATVGQSNLERHNQQDLLGRMLNGEMDD